MRIYVCMGHPINLWVMYYLTLWSSIGQMNSFVTWSRCNLGHPNGNQGNNVTGLLTILAEGLKVTGGEVGGMVPGQFCGIPNNIVSQLWICNSTDLIGKNLLFLEQCVILLFRQQAVPPHHHNNYNDFNTLSFRYRADTWKDPGLLLWYCQSTGVVTFTTIAIEPMENQIWLNLTII